MINADCFAVFPRGDGLQMLPLHVRSSAGISGGGSSVAKRELESRPLGP